MANKILLDAFLRALQNSKSYNLLDPKEQTRLMGVFLHASDDQLLQAIEALKIDSRETAHLEEEMKKKEDEQLKMAQDIKVTLKEIDRKKLTDEEAKDHAVTSKEADLLLAKLLQMEDRK